MDEVESFQSFYPALDVGPDQGGVSLIRIGIPECVQPPISVVSTQVNWKGNTAAFKK